MRTACIVQARVNSTRFLGKVTEDLAGKSVLQRVLERCKAIRGIDAIVLAIPDSSENDTLENIAANVGIDATYRGSEGDVLDRFTRAAELVDADVVMRVTADCPLIDPTLCSVVLDTFFRHKCDYASNLEPRTFPKGLDCEVFTYEALKMADLRATEAEDQEHVTSYMRRPEAKMRRKSVGLSGANLSDKRWTLDWPEDLAFIQALYEHGDPKDMEATLAILKTHPELEEINAMRKAA